MNILTREEAELLRAMRNMTPEDRQAMEGFISGLAENDPTALWVAGLVNAGQIHGRLALAMLRAQTEH